MSKVTYEIIEKNDRLFFHDGKKYVLFDSGFTMQPKKSSASVDGTIGPFSANVMPQSFFSSFRMLFAGQANVSDIAGPVGAVEIVGDEYDSAKEEGTLAVVVSMLNIALLLSANIGIVNLFPIPAFDGGKLLFLIYEAIRGKPADSKVEGTIQLVGVGLLLILLVIVMYNDISRLFMG